MKICIYPGSFDPFTNGHLDILRRAAKLFDKAIVAVLNNPAKKSFFTLEERMEHIKKAAAEQRIENVRVMAFTGLLVDAARENDAKVIVRGLRAVMDFEYELQMSSANKELAPEIETVFLMASPRYSFLSSSIVKEIGMFGGDIGEFIPAVNQKKVCERLKSK